MSPRAGPAILAPNHFSNLDHFLLAMYLRREVQFMAKSQLFHPPIDFIMNHGGAFPVLRGKHDEEAFITAHTILGRGGVVAMYGEGGRSRSKQLGKPKAGLGRLALESGVPVVPVAIHGSEHARDLRFPKVTIQYGEPLASRRSSSPAASKPSTRRFRCSSASGRCTTPLRDEGSPRRSSVSSASEGGRVSSTGTPTYVRAEQPARTRAREDEGRLGEFVGA